jgi:hypothetical protein
MISRRERVTWALVFSVPPGVGIAIATARVSGDPITTPLVLASFAVPVVVLFALVYGAATINQGAPADTAGDADAPGVTGVTVSANGSDDESDDDAGNGDARDGDARDGDARDGDARAGDGSVETDAADDRD